MFSLSLSELERALTAGEDVENKGSRDGLTRLHHAVCEEDLPKVMLLLRFGADVHVANNWGDRPIHAGVASAGENEEARAEILKVLLEAGADPNAEADYKDTPLSYAYMRDESPLCVRALIEAGADPTKCGAYGTRIPPFVVNLLRNPDGAEVVRDFLAAAPDVNAKDQNGHTLLDRAAYCGSPSAVEALLRARADGGVKSKCPPLCYASLLMGRDGGEAAVLALIKAGADVNAKMEQSLSTPLHSAVRFGSLAAAQLLLNSGANPNLLNRCGRTPLCDAVRRPGSREMVSILLHGGADVNGQDEDESTPLHHASQQSVNSPCTEMASLLLESGADVNAKGRDGKTALHYASRWRPPSFIQLLLKSGADPHIRDDSGCTALHDATDSMDCTEIICALLAVGADINAKDCKEETPLHYASQRCPPSAIRLLLESGADLHSRDADGRTPIFCTTHGPYTTENTMILIEAGADIHAKDNHGETPLYHAISMSSISIIRLLLQQGADLYAGGMHGVVALHSAIQLLDEDELPAVIAALLAHIGVDLSAPVENYKKPEQSLSSEEFANTKVLMNELRKAMLAQPSYMRDPFIPHLSQLYGILEYYPTDSPLHKCEIKRSKGEPSGFGGFADCWEGTFLGRYKVAMKTPRDIFDDEVKARRLAREVAVWGRLNHPNILPFLGTCTLRDKSYVVSPWMENGHALEFVEKHPEANCLKLLAQVAAGLEYLHTFQPVVIHGDIKGSNVFISKSGNACIADFGLSELQDEGRAGQNYSTPWLVAGHPRWQAPEILQAQTNEEARRTTTTDVLAFGRVMLELFTRKAPFDGIDDVAVMWKVRANEHPQRPCEEEIVQRGLDDNMWGIMMDCWDAVPSRRPSATELVSRLNAALGAESEREPSPRPKKRLRVSSLSE